MRSRIINSADSRIIAYKQEQNIVTLKSIAEKNRLSLVIVDDDDAETPLGFFAGFKGFQL